MTGWNGEGESAGGRIQLPRNGAQSLGRVLGQGVLPWQLKGTSLSNLGAQN